jgi:hypothetical protein
VERAALQAELASRDWNKLDRDLHRVLASGRKRSGRSGHVSHPRRPPGLLDPLADALEFAAIIERSFKR